jgi:hypothetical protein
MLGDEGLEDLAADVRETLAELWAPTRGWTLFWATRSARSPL